MLWARPACFYRCQCLIGVNVTCASAIAQFINCVEFGRWRLVFFMGIRLVFVDMASRTIRKEIRSGEGYFFVVLFVAAQTCRCIRAMIFIGWRLVGVWQHR